MNEIHQAHESLAWASMVFREEDYNNLETNLRFPYLTEECPCLALFPSGQCNNCLANRGHHSSCLRCQGRGRVLIPLEQVQVRELARVADISDCQLTIIYEIGGEGRVIVENGEKEWLESFTEIETDIAAIVLALARAMEGEE